MSARPALRLFQASRAARMQVRQTIPRRFQTTNAAPAAPPQSLAARLWNSPVGVKTVHFWAPVMKWGLVIAGVSDFARPAESLSLTQNLALMCTGAIWTRWCLIIKPRNVLLAAVNFFLGCVGVTQVARIALYNQSVKNQTLPQQIEGAGKDAKETAQSAVKDAEAKAKKVLN